MIENVRALIDLGGGWLKDYVRNLVAILRSPREFMRSRDLDAGPTFIDASVFAALVSLLNLVIQIPIYRTLGVNVETPAFILVDTVFTYGFWFIYGSILHGSARLFGGGASYQASVACFLFMSAFRPLILIVTAPSEFVARRMVLDSPDVGGAAFYQRALPALASSPRATVLLILALAANCYFFFALVSAFRAVHAVSRIRAFFIVAVGLVGWVAISSLVEVPAFQALWQSFKKPAG